MGSQTKNSTLASQIYLVVNCLNIVFMAYIVLRHFNIFGFLYLSRTVFLGSIVAFIILLNFLNRYASNNGGTGNPVRVNKKPRTVHYIALGLFITGLLLEGVFKALPNVILISILALPVEIFAIYLGQTIPLEDDDTDLIDDFEINEN